MLMQPYGFNCQREPAAAFVGFLKRRQLNSAASIINAEAADRV